ncbi:unnamed protein product [Penicillium camemberti]|uniref:Str. FM013 n=1 Tax=Penicillium camemberti (strain FM 013) TaxID=1429867 RepID=A0A0G4PWR3_PENC3|nr:unnamed protein product [Penicillium camemberti]
MVKKLDIKPNAAVAFDWKCQAVHVALSPWRFYLDVKYEPGLRIAVKVYHRSRGTLSPILRDR